MALRRSPSLCCPPLAPNGLGIGVRAGFHKGSDGSKTPKILQSVTRDNAPPDAKPLVVGSCVSCVTTPLKKERKKTERNLAKSVTNRLNLQKLFYFSTKCQLFMHFFSQKNHKIVKVIETSNCQNRRNSKPDRFLSAEIITTLSSFTILSTVKIVCRTLVKSAHPVGRRNSQTAQRKRNATGRSNQSCI